MRKTQLALTAAASLTLLFSVTACSGGLSETEYVDSVKGLESFPPADDATIVDLGKQVCGELESMDAGDRAGFLEMFVGDSGAADVPDRQRFVDLSIKAFCPGIQIG